MYHTKPPTDKTILEWYMNSSTVAACALRNEQAVRANIFAYFSIVRLLVHYLRLNIYISNIQQAATVCRYLFTTKLLYMFRVSIAPSPGVYKIVTAASGTGHSI